MRLLRAAGMAAALVLAAVVGGTLIGSAFATDDPSTSETDASGYCDTFLDTLAAELDATRDELTAAGKAAALATIDAAAAAGDLTAERADALRERVEAADGEGCAGLFKLGWIRGFHRGAVRGFLGGDVFEAAADALGIDSAELIGQLREAGSLEALAGEVGVAYDDVKASVLDAVQADLDAAVAQGLSQERADAVIDHLAAWLDDGGSVGGLRPHRGLPGPWGGHGDGVSPDAPGA